MSSLNLLPLQALWSHLWRHSKIIGECFSSLVCMIALVETSALTKSRYIGIGFKVGLTHTLNEDGHFG